MIETEGRLRLPGHKLKLAFREWNPDGVHKVLALHGWLDNANSYARLAPLLPTSIHLVALDFPGHGYSDHLPPSGHYTMLDVAEICAEALTVLNWERYSILAHSMGAGAAVVLHSIVSNSIHKMVFMEGLGPFSYDPDKTFHRWNEYLTKKVRTVPSRLPVYKTIEEAAKARSENSDFGLDCAQLLAVRGVREIEQGGFTWRTDQRLVLPTVTGLSETAVRNFIAEIQCPCLLLFGEKGFLFQKFFVPWLEERIHILTNYSLKILKGGHHLHLQEPITVAGAIQEFFM